MLESVGYGSNFIKTLRTRANPIDFGSQGFSSFCSSPEASVFFWGPVVSDTKVAGRVYRTGDLASWTEKGFELRGRKDHQAGIFYVNFDQCPYLATVQSLCV